MKKLSRILCLLMTCVMMFYMIGGVPVSASEDDPTVPVTEPPWESEQVTAEETDPPLETEPILETLPISAEETLTEDMGLFSTRATYQEGKYRQRAVIWNTVGEKVNYTYNGKVNSYNTLLMHTLWYNEQWNAAYCIEPGKTLYVNSDYDEVENTGVDPWGKLDYNKQRGVGLALLYGYPNGIDSSDLKTQIAYQLATYLIVHEIILGWREDTHPFTRTNDHYFDVFGGGTPEKIEKLEITSEYHSSIHTKHLNNEDVWFAYNHISNALATHDLIPSFAASHKNMAPTHTMVSNGDGTYSITLTDSNNILSAYTFNSQRLEYTCKPGANEFECLMYLYGEEIIMAFPESVKLKKLYFTESGYDTKQVGSFVTENPLFNRLMEKCIRTLYVCMRNNFMDCPDRERGQWIGDVSVQVPQVFFVFDDAAKKLLKKAVEDFIYLRKGDVLVGNVPGQHFSELPGQSLVAISEYGLIGEYYHYSQDPEIPELVLEPAVNYLKLWELDDEGLLIPRKGNWYWFDHRYNVDAPVLENCMYVAAAKYALKMAELSGNHNFDSFLNERIETLTQSIERKFWNGKYYTSGTIVDDRANAIAVLSGICPKDRYEKVMKILVTVYNSTPYFERFVLTALCEMGYIHHAYQRMMTRYYPLIINENSTLWEDFYLLGTRNHAWSGGPLEIAFKYILGLKTEDGFKTYSMAPVKGIFREIHCAFQIDGNAVEKHIVE